MPGSAANKFKNYKKGAIALLFLNALNNSPINKIMNNLLKFSWLILIAFLYSIFVLIMNHIPMAWLSFDAVAGLISLLLSFLFLKAKEKSTGIPFRFFQLFYLLLFDSIFLLV